MDPSFQRVLTRARPLGNPARKYIHVIKRHCDLFLDRLEASGHLSRVHIDRVAARVAEDFDLVAGSGRGQAEKLKLLGTFYAAQYLQLNARALERLAVDLTESDDRVRAYWSYLTRVEEEFNALTTTYIRRVLRVVLPSKARGPFVICSVGTRYHQDDIDVMVVIDPEAPDREAVDRAMARLGEQMLRYASILDHYLAAQVVSDGICVTPQEIGAALRAGHFNYVMVTELLRAVPLVGNKTLFRSLQAEVVDEYFHHPGRYSYRHELYLRGILGEARSLLLRPDPPGSVQPKMDALRMIMGLTSAMKTIHQLRPTEPRELLRILQRHRPGLREPLAHMEESLAFLETFRHLGQLLIAMEEQVDVEGESARENLQNVAEAMGYYDRGPVKATDFLLVHYHEAVARARKAAGPVMEDIGRHLARTSRSSQWTRGSFTDEELEDFASGLASGLQAFRGVKFWDDVLEAFEDPDRRLIKAFSDSFMRLPEQHRSELADMYAEWGRNAPYSFVTLVNILGVKDKATPEIIDAFLTGLTTSAEAVRALSRVFRYYPDVTNRFLLLMESEQLEKLQTTLDVPIGDPEVAAVRDRLKSLVAIHRQTSRYVKRVLRRLTVSYPATVLALNKSSNLRVLAKGRLADGERHSRSEDQKGFLGDYYDMEFLRIATETLRGASIDDTCAEFAELTRTYLSGILDVCMREAEKEAGGRMPQRDRLAIFLTGGNARGRPYDEDFDLIVLVNSNDPQVIRIAERAIVRMNRQIARRGVIAQYRLGEHFGRFVSTVDEIHDLMKDGIVDFFVDCCQLLHSRLLVGAQRVERAMLGRLIRPLIFEKWHVFFKGVQEEVTERRKDFKAMPKDYLHLKEMPGGLREIDLCLAAAKAGHRVRETWTDTVFDRLIRQDPEHGSQYRVLMKASDFLVALRSAYRVSVAASDVLERSWLREPARIMGLEQAGGSDPAGYLYDKVCDTFESSVKAIDRIMADLADLATREGG